MTATGLQAMQVTAAQLASERVRMIKEFREVSWEYMPLMMIKF